MFAFANSLGSKPGNLANQQLLKTRGSCAMLLMTPRPLESGSVRAGGGGYSASNLSLILILHPVQMLAGEEKEGQTYFSQ